MAKINNKAIVDNLIISYVNTANNGRPLLVIGRKTRGNDDIDVVNAFTGKEADDIYNSLFRGVE